MKLRTCGRGAVKNIIFVPKNQSLNLKKTDPALWQQRTKYENTIHLTPPPSSHTI